MGRKHTSAIPRTTSWDSNVNANFLAVDEAVQATESEVQAARGNRASVDARLSQALDDDGNPLPGVAFAAQPFWTEEGAAITYLSGASFSVAGDKAGIYYPGSNAGRALKATQTNSGYGYMESASYASGAGITTVLVTGITLDAGLSKIEYGQDPRTSPQLKTVLNAAGGGADHTVSGTTTQFQAGQSFSFNKVGQMASNGKMALASASSNASAVPGLAMAVETIASNASGEYLLNGFARDDSWSWSVGGLVYLGGAAGGMTQTYPSNAGEYVQVLGVATQVNRMFFNPNYAYGKVK